MLRKPEFRRKQKKTQEVQKKILHVYEMYMCIKILHVHTQTCTFAHI